MLRPPDEYSCEDRGQEKRMLQKVFFLLRSGKIYCVIRFGRFKILHLKGTSVDIFSEAKRSEVMSGIRSTGNKTTEIPLARAMRSAGVRGWRRHVSVRLGSKSVRPDFVFSRQRLVVFVDGCFWHGCPQHGTRPKSNREFWDRKLDANIARDARLDSSLKSEGWSVLRFWEHAVKADSDGCARKIALHLGFPA